MKIPTTSIIAQFHLCEKLGALQKLVIADLSDLHKC